MVKCMNEDNGGKGARWSEELTGRYLSMSHRLDSEAIQSLLLSWECKCGRNTLIDSITVLRAATGTATDDAELKSILTTLFLEQCAGLRTSIKSNTSATNNDPRTPPNVMKALLIRQHLFVHLKGIFPKMADVIDSYGTTERYVRDRYGVNGDGSTEKDFVREDDSEEEVRLASKL